MISYDYGEIYIDEVKQTPAMLMDYIVGLERENKVMRELLKDFDEANIKRTYGNLGSVITRRMDSIPCSMATGDN